MSAPHSPQDPIADALSEFMVPSALPRRDDGTSERRIGNFVLEHRLGEGGFGIVYLARQTGEIDREVALKVLRNPLGGGEAERRFVAERQILALLEHPSIASIHEAGVSDSGQPYFVMEYVDGETITEHCEREEVELRERLRLFAEVCDAVHFAHERGVVHRDLKPSNVLVSTVGGAAAAKVIDFGIAKLLVEQDDAPALRTRTGQILGTPEYMSPEQADGLAGDLDARCDVYSLGVMLYELITGTLPLLERGSAPVSLHEILQTVREVEPERPSKRLAAKGTSGTRKWTRDLREDLDWICLRALEKDRERRYATARDLGADVRRFLANETVMARPPSRSYQVTKFVRRHRVLVVATSLVMLALVAGVIASVYQLNRAVHYLGLAEDSAEVARGDRQRFDGLRLAAQARLIEKREPTLAALLALEAAELVEDATVNDTLYGALSNLTEKAVLTGLQAWANRPAVFTQDGTKVAWALEDPTVMVWDADTGEVVHRLRHGDAKLTAVTWETPGDEIAVADEDGEVVVWDMQTGEKRQSFRIEEGRVTELYFDLTGATVMSACSDGWVRLHDVASGELRARAGPFVGNCWGLAMSRSGKYLAARFRPGRPTASLVHLWDLEENRSVQVIDEVQGYYATYSRRLLSSPANDLFAFHSIRRDREGHHLGIVDPVSGELSFVDGFVAYEFASGGKELVGVADTITDSACLGRYALDEGVLDRGSAFPSGDLATWLADGTPIWRIESSPKVSATSTRDEVKLAGHRYNPSHVIVDPPRKRIATASPDRTMRLWDLDSPLRPKRLPVRDVIERSGLVDSASGLRVLSIDPEDPRVVQVYNVDRDEVEVRLVDAHRDKCELSSDGRRVVVLAIGRMGENADEGVVRVADVDVGTTRTLRFDEFVPNNFRLSRDGETAVFSAGAHLYGGKRSFFPAWRVGLNDGSASRLDVDIAVYPTVFMDWNEAAGRFAIRHDHQAGTVRKTSDGSVIWSFGGHGGDHLAYALSRDGKRLLSTGVAKTAMIRDIETGEILTQFVGLEGECLHAGFLKDETLAWAQSRESIKIFDAQTGKAFASLTPFQGQFCRPTESADGQYLLTITRTGWFQRFPLDPVAYAREVMPRELEPEELELYQIGTPEERIERMKSHARRLGIGTRFERVARILHRGGDNDGAIEMLEEGVATDTYEVQVWEYLFERLCDKAEGLAPGRARREVLDRAAQVLQRVSELGRDPAKTASSLDASVWKGHGELERLTGN